MPLFEFRCLDCEELFEALVLNKEEVSSCIACKSANIEKQFSPFGIKSKGEFSPSSHAGGGCGCSPTGCGCGVKV